MNFKFRQGCVLRRQMGGLHSTNRITRRQRGYREGGRKGLEAQESRLHLIGLVIVVLFLGGSPRCERTSEIDIELSSGAH